jgi:ribosomal protein L9
MTNLELVSELASLRPSSTFLALKGYRNSYGEVADYNISFHISYTKLLERSLDVLANRKPTTSIERRAKSELTKSFNDSLERAVATPIEEREDGYTHFVDLDTGNYIKGVKLHDASNTLHIYGLVNSKQIIEQGKYPKVNKRQLTIAKDKLRKLCPVSRFRQFVISPEKVERISVQGLSLLPPVSDEEGK